MLSFHCSEMYDILTGRMISGSAFIHTFTLTVRGLRSEGLGSLPSCGLLKMDTDLESNQLCDMIYKQ